MAINNDFIVKSGLVVKANTTIPETGSLLTSSVVRTIAKPALDLNFTKSKTIDPRLTFNRTTVASYTNSAGVISYAQPNQPRIDYNPDTKACKGLMIEEYRLNQFTYSQAFDNAGWSKSTALIAPDVYLAPDGTMTAQKLNLTSNTANFYMFQDTSLTTSTVYTQSIYAKAAEQSVLQIATSTGFNYGTNYVNFDLISGTIQAQVGTEPASITSAGNGWYRCTYTSTATSTISGRMLFVITGGVGGRLPSVVGTPNSGIYIWGAQLEAGYFPTSYIPTASTTAARNKDTCYILGQNFQSWFNPNAGSFYMEADATYSTLKTDYPRLLSFSDGSSQTNTIQYILYTATSGSQIAVWKGGSYLAGTGNSITSGSLLKAAFGYDQTGYTAWQTPTTTAMNATFPGLPPMDRVSIGSDASGGAGMTGHIKRFTYWPQKLSGTQLQALTV